MGEDDMTGVWEKAAILRYRGREGVLYRSRDDLTVWCWNNNVFYAQNGEAAMDTIEAYKFTPKKNPTLYCLMIVHRLEDQE